MCTLRHLLLATSLALGLPCFAQTAAALDETPAPAEESPAPSDLAPGNRFTRAWGVGLLRYQEPGLMRLSGPEASLQVQYQPEHPNLPDRLQLDLGAGLLDYDSTRTGQLHHRAALNGRGTALWRIHSAPGNWHAGLQIDLAWTDLRGTSSTGHRGYRRLGSKAWAVLEHESTEGARTSLGILVRGRQDSLLSDVGNRDVTNTQRSGYFLAYQHVPLAPEWLSARPWARLSQVSRSDNDGIYYEPRNRTLQLGVLFDF